VLYALLLATYSWETLSASVIAYLVFLPFSARAYSKRADLEEAAEAAMPPK
jgi:CDP-diacylglycerol--serine O-phosphatidyltransferase